MGKLTKKQELFVCEYLVDLNATQAAIRAGYSEKTSAEQGARLLRNVNVKNYIDEKLKEVESQKIMQVQEILERFTSIARGETSEEYLTSADEIITLKTKKKDELKALELLGKYHSLFTDKIQLEDSSISLNIGGFKGVIDEC